MAAGFSQRILGFTGSRIQSHSEKLAFARPASWLGILLPMRHLAVLVPALALAACFQSDPDPEAEEGVPVRVLIAYSDSDTGRFPDYDARIRKAFAETKEIFAASGTGVRLELAQIAKVPFTPEERILDLQRLVRKKDGHMDGIHVLRDQSEADIVVLLSPLPNATVNGSLLTEENTAFVISDWAHVDGPIWGMAHEMSHLFGTLHFGDTSVVARQFPQGFPFVDDSVRTILAFGAQEPVPYFSNPDLAWHGRPLGVKGRSDMASVIRMTAAYISGFRGRKTPTDFVPSGSVPSADFSE